MDVDQRKKEYKKLADSLFSNFYTEENLKKMEQSIMTKNKYQILYSRGGLCLPRGYYCPSLLMELIITNVSRGRILKKKAKKNPDYTYYFDNGELKLVGKEDDGIGGTDFEWIAKNGNIEYSIFKGATNRITVSEYENKKIAKNRFLTVFSKSQYKLILEDYNYDKENKLTSAIYKSVSVFWNAFFEDEYYFDFLYDENGNLSNYLINKESEARIPSIIKALITGNEESEKKNLQESEVVKALQSIIEDWKGEDVYAISVFINHDRAEVIDFAVSCNHEEQQWGEERWNYAFWEQDEKSLMNLLAEREINWKKLLDITSSAVIKLREKDFFRQNFGKDIAVIIHGYEYEDDELEATRKANPNGEANEFFRYLNH